MVIFDTEGIVEEMVSKIRAGKYFLPSPLQVFLILKLTWFLKCSLLNHHAQFHLKRVFRFQLFTESQKNCIKVEKLLGLIFFKLKLSCRSKYFFQEIEEAFVKHEYFLKKINFQVLSFTFLNGVISGKLRNTNEKPNLLLVRAMHLSLSVLSH